MDVGANNVDHPFRPPHITPSNTTRKRRAPGILALLPDTLPFYPYNPDITNCSENFVHGRRGRRRNKSRQDEEIDATIEEGKSEGNRDMIPDAPLKLIPSENISTGINCAVGEFTLFFFVDSTNRQSLLAIPLVSKWFHYALNQNHYTNKDISSDKEPIHYGRNKIICIPNHAATSTEQSLPILRHTGFYHLPFHHSARLPLLHMLNATRVPSLIVVRNDTGRIVTQYGWEAIEREGGAGGSLANWLERMHIEAGKCKKLDGDGSVSVGEKSCGDKETDVLEMMFVSHVVEAWRNGKSGLPMWWHALSWII